MKKTTSLLFILSLILFSSNQLFSQISTFPHSVSFETASDLSTTSGDAMSQWATATSGTAGHSQTFDTSTIAFTRHSGYTPTSASTHYTGPASASAGTHYVYMESSNTDGDDKAELAAIYDFSGRTNAQITFDYHNYRASGYNTEYGPASAALWVYNTETFQWKKNWNTTNNSSSWQSVTVDLSEYNGMVVQLWFSANPGNGDIANGALMSDFALDNIVVDPAPIIVIFVLFKFNVCSVYVPAPTFIVTPVPVSACEIA